MTNHSETTGSAANGNDRENRDARNGDGRHGDGRSNTGGPGDGRNGTGRIGDGRDDDGSGIGDRVGFDAHGAEHQVTLRTPGELADALPYLLGYRPEDSLSSQCVHPEPP
jgi:hypothetical protein